MNFFRRFLQKLTSCTTEKRDEKPKKENLRLNRDSLYTNQPGPITSRRNSEVQNLTGIINSSTRRNSYVNPYNGESIEWEERKMDYKSITVINVMVVQPLSENIATMKTFFAETNNLDWKSCDHIPGNRMMWSCRLKGAVPMGICKMAPGGYFKLHWHNETEHYLVVSGQGRITIGSEERDVCVDKFPTLITIPGNVPHQTYNPGREDLVWFYFFPETTSTKKMRYFYPNGKVYEQYPLTLAEEKRFSQSV